MDQFSVRCVACGRIIRARPRVFALSGPNACALPAQRNAGIILATHADPGNPRRRELPVNPD